MKNHSLAQQEIDDYHKICQGEVLWDRRPPKCWYMYDGAADRMEIFAQAAQYHRCHSKTKTAADDT